MKVFQKVPFLILFGLGKNMIDIEGGLYLAEVLIKLLELKFDGKLKIPKYFQSLFA